MIAKPKLLKKPLLSMLVLMVFLGTGYVPGPPTQVAYLPESVTMLPAIPEGFFEILSAPGVSLYKKDYSPGKPDYVQVARLDQDASVTFLNGNIVDPGIGGGIYGGDNPLFERLTVQQFWNNSLINSPNTFCVGNGQFFSTNEDPTPLAFPFKVNNKIVSDGYGINEYPNQKLMLLLWDDHADILPLTKDTLLSSTAPNIIAGLSENADKGVNSPNQRTFLGVADQDKDGKFESVLVFNSELASQTEAAEVLHSWGAKKVIMLDGGGSTQLICQGETYISSSRTIPQAVAILSQPIPPFAAEIVDKTNWKILIEGENAEISLKMKNVGTATWKSSEVTLENLSNPWGAGNTLFIPKDVAPGETIGISWQTAGFDNTGIKTSKWQLTHTSQQIEGRDVTIQLVVLPKQLEEKKEELEQQINGWLAEEKQQMVDLILDWLKTEGSKVAGNLFSKCFPQIGLLISVSVMMTIQRRRKAR